MGKGPAELGWERAPCASKPYGISVAQRSLVVGSRNGMARLHQHYQGHMSESSIAIRREARKIRYYAHEWEKILAQARACNLPPATFVRQVSLGATPPESPNRAQDQLILELSRLATELQHLRRLTAQADDSADQGQLDLVLDETLAAIRRIGG